MLAAFRARRAVAAEQRRAALRERDIEDAERDLRDAVYIYDKWGFGLPSHVEGRRNDVLKAIRRLERLGGEPLDVIGFGKAYLVHKALPDLYETHRPIGQNWWNVRRVGDEGDGRH